MSYNEDIRPILSDNCFLCHGRDEKNRQGHRRLDTAEGAAEEHENFRGIVSGNPSDSEVWQRITSTDEAERMPPANSPKPPLKAEQRELIKRWIEQGAEYQNHWSYESLGPVAVPPPSGGAGDSTIDRFIGEKLAAQQLALAKEAPREILLRRVTLDLTGLPPTTREIDAFLADRKPGAYERVVERLLRSPHDGEHIARGWLDAVRYADTHGMHLDSERTLWPYRDWVVRAFNENKPFDRFTVEQLAGDLLQNPTLNQLIASGYNRANISTSEGGAIAAEAEARNTSDRVDTTAEVWLGLTANCASCHDHKFDPLKQKEYYSLGAFFKGLADPVWDGNVRLPGPRVLLANTEQQPRLDVIASELPRLEKALHTRGDDRLPFISAAAPNDANRVGKHRLGDEERTCVSPFRTVFRAVKI